MKMPVRVRAWWVPVAVVASLAAGCQGQSAPPGEATLSFEAQLAQHLQAEGDVMYGAYWCPHCADQKDMFDQASDQIPYVECDPKGEKAQPQLCQQKGIQGYPTWEINGELYPGVRSLNEIAELSGFATTPSQSQ